MEREPEDQEEFSESHRSASSPQSSVLWEKCIQQSFFVDLSEDESIHFSDLEASFTMHLSQAALENSIHLSGNVEQSVSDHRESTGNVEQSVSDHRESTGNSSFASSQSERVVQGEIKTMNCVACVSAQRPNTEQGNSIWEETQADTSDEDQEDLPYDEDLGCQYVNSGSHRPGALHSRHNVNGHSDLPAMVEEVNIIQDPFQIKGNTMSPASPNKRHSKVDSNPTEAVPAHNSQVGEAPFPDINQLLLRHFSQDELLCSARGIESETIPEVSLLESSMDETIQSRTRSFSELKYGQGQVHFPLPDFTKVAPKVKIPKSTPGTVRPVSQSPTFLRAQSSPGMLGRSSTLEVISRAMEDSVQSSERPYMFRDQDKQTGSSSGLVTHLQAEYDKLLTKYAEAENLIDQMRLGTNTKATSDFTLEFDCSDKEELCLVGSHFGSALLPNTPSPLGQCSDEPHQPNPGIQPTTSTQTDLQGPTEGDRMTCELRDIICQFMQKLDEFKTCLYTKSITIEEQQMVFKSIMAAQDQLERRYISKKEEHRTLEMQNYMGLARNTGQFDPERQVEGEIFRIGMHLEDIKDLVDKNRCELELSPHHPPSRLTPLPVCEEPRPGLLTASPPPALPQKVLALQDPGLRLDTMEANEVHLNEGLDLSCDVTSADFLLNSSGHGSFSLRLSQGSLDRLDINTEEEVERRSVLSEGTAHKRVLHCFAEKIPGTPDRLWTSESLLQSPVSSDWESSLREKCNLAVNDSSSSDVNTKSVTEKTPSFSQRIVSLETDSGFGSSDLSRPVTGFSQPEHGPESFMLQCDVNGHSQNMSDSDGSCSNLQTTMRQPVQMEQRRPSLQTAVHPAGLNGDRRPSLQTPVQLQLSRTPMEHCVTSAQTVPARLHECDSQRPRQHSPEHQSKPSISINTLQKDCRSHTCPCHSGAIQALQSEVSQLKRDLEDGLVQLPHLAQRMDHLTSRYRQDRDRRSKTRPRTTHHKPAGSRRILTNTKIEDWISSDMEPSTSRGDPDSEESDHSGILLPFHSTPLDGRRGSSKPYTCSDEPWKPQSKKHSTTERNYEMETSSINNSGPPVLRLSQKNSSFRYQCNDLHPASGSAAPPGDIQHNYYKARYPPSSKPREKPLLQVNYGSSCSLPANFKVWEQNSVSQHRRISTQSDSALLPSNIYFQRTLPPAHGSPKTGGRSRRHMTNKEEDINRTLDRAIEAALCMKRTTDKMAKSLSADLAKAAFYRKLHGLKPLTGVNTAGYQHSDSPS
ncbi:hypothetical protein UPYG_G00295550 [Umbra pygmaea]|uniref:Uncharacterized protein n=1 Tax=Umbra pygmaea TaxID=75934 RepID=A0ABD0W6G0_UMBPY